MPVIALPHPHPACTDASHARLKASPAWEALPVLGWQDDFRGGWIEMKLCPACASSLGVSVAERSVH